MVHYDHMLARVDRALDLSWLREAVADCYRADDYPELDRPITKPEFGEALELANRYGDDAADLSDVDHMRTGGENDGVRKRCWFAKGARRHKSEGLPRLRARASVGICRPSANLEYVLKDLFHRPRRNPKGGETRLVRRCDRVDLHQVHLITRDGCSW